MRTHIRWNASKFMHRRKYHKLLNKQLIFETISNTWKSIRTKPNQTEKKTIITKNQINNNDEQTYILTMMLRCLKYSLSAWFLVVLFLFGVFYSFFQPNACLKISFQTRCRREWEREKKSIEMARICSKTPIKEQQMKIKGHPSTKWNMLQIITDKQNALFFSKYSHVRCSIMQ